MQSQTGSGMPLHTRVIANDYNDNVEAGRMGDEDLDDFYPKNRVSHSIADLSLPSSSSLAFVRYIDENPYTPSEEIPLERLKMFMNPYDGRFEDLKSWSLLLRDFTAGAIVAMIAIPLAMGFAIASGMRPVHGIVGGAVAAFIGAAYGGSKYQVYGPTATLVPVIAGIMATYGSESYDEGHAVLVTVSICSGLCLMLLGFGRFGRLVHLVPQSIVVGFTNGIAISIFFSELEETLGIKETLEPEFFAKLGGLYAHLDDFNIWCVIFAIFTAVIIKVCLMISLYIPGPLIVMACCTLVEKYLLHDKGIILVVDKYGRIPSHLLDFTAPGLPNMSIEVLLDLGYHILGVIFVSSMESLLCSRMADRLAKNQGQPCNPNKELWGQGMANVCVPLLNGFPNSGALMRTAINVECGAVSPMSGIFMCCAQLLLAFVLARFLEQIPMACVGGILLYVSFSMVSLEEIKEVLNTNRFHTFLMLWCTVVVPVTTFLTGVASAIVIYAVFRSCFDSNRSQKVEELGKEEEDEPLLKPEIDRKQYS